VTNSTTGALYENTIEFEVCPATSTSIDFNIPTPVAGAMKDNSKCDVCDVYVTSIPSKYTLAIDDGPN
jgi:hypothetical protein